MGHPIFSDGWAKACASQLNDREGYRRAAATWEGSVVLLMTGDPPEAIDQERRVLLDLWSGGCREARTAVPSDEEPARYVMAGSPATWAQVLTGRLAPSWPSSRGASSWSRAAWPSCCPTWRWPPNWWQRQRRWKRCFQLKIEDFRLKICGGQDCAEMSAWLRRGSRPVHRTPAGAA